MYDAPRQRKNYHTATTTIMNTDNERRIRNSRSKLYERYNVNVNKPSSSSSSGRRKNRRDTERRNNEDDEHIKDRTMQKLRLVAFALILFTMYTRVSTKSKEEEYETISVLRSSGTTDENSFIDIDPAEPEVSGLIKSQSYVSDNNNIVELPQHKKMTNEEYLASIEEEIATRHHQQQQLRKKRWNPCINSNKYELERHDHEKRHGDVCRAKGGMMGIYECPMGCHETGGNAPYCANSESVKSSSTSPRHTLGEKGGACRVRNPDAPPEYRCDDGSICIMTVKLPAGEKQQQNEDVGQYYDDTCDNQCFDGRRQQMEHKCNSDMDCSLSGVCTSEGKCQCEPWADGADCSYLKFKPVDKSKLGYLDEHHSSWGGSIVQKSNGEYLMYVSEITCKEDPGTRKRCGLNNWETHSRITQVISYNIEGPYERMKDHPVILDPEHHNPSVHVSPMTGDWHLYTISGPSGPIERMLSNDEGKSWSNPMTVSPRQNPGPLLNEDGTTYLYYRADGMDIPSPTCSDEGIAMQICKSENEACDPPNHLLVFPHTGEDPSVFKDDKGRYHMLFNALPYKCVPKWQQGGHAWSLDGINWSAPRLGAFDTTIQFTDGTNMKCERRERPQMVIGKDGKPLALVSGVTGCPKALGYADIAGNWKYYRGGDDSFTLIQKMGT